MTETLPPTANEIDYLVLGRQVIRHEAQALTDLADSLGPEFTKTVQMILACQGRVIFTGIGKPGHIARKLAATFASTGTPAFFIHPAEAAHGDLGMFTAQDLVIAFSHSGSTAELIYILPIIQSIGAQMIAVTSRPDSPLAKAAVLTLLTGVTDEAGPLGLAPTTSATAMLALGDALGLAAAAGRGFTRDQFFRFHPGGALGALGKT
jgi:arabinose-5-phosphate isomerase